MAAERTPTFRRRIIVGLSLTGAVVAVSGGGAAYAYWSGQSGAGSGVATTTPGLADVHLVAVTGGNDPSTLLSPGRAADLIVEVNNPNPRPVTIVSITQAGDVTPVGGTGPGPACTGGSSGTTGVTVPTQTVSLSVASGPQIVLHIPGGALMSMSSASGCQGASFHIPLTATVQQ